MAVINELNSAPYFDDFSPETKDFLRILFRPGYAVQARELNQLQAILQTQVERFGNHIFKDGSIVIGGMTTIDTKTAKYLKIQDNFNGDEVEVDEFVGKEITGAGGAKGLVVAVADNDDDTPGDPKTLIYKPLNGLPFVESEQINATGVSALVAASSFNGPSSTVSIDSGIFYTKGIFVINNQQTTYLDKYSNTPDKKAGLISEIDLIDESDDSTLLDNANGSYNYAAPGAHRLKINLILAAKNLSFTTDADKFIELLEVRSGSLYKQITRPIYSEIERTLARRTFDESGDYTVKPFILDLQNHPTDNTKLRAYLESGKGYVKGYEFETIARQSVDINKARDFETYSGYDVPLNYGNYVIVTLDEGYPDISSFETLKLYTASSEIGSCQVSSIKIHNANTSPLQYKLYLFNITLTSGTFSSVRSVRNVAGTKIFPLESPYTLYETDLRSYVFKSGLNSLKTFTDGLGAADTDYSTKRVFANRTVTANSVSIQTANSSERFQGTAGSAQDTTTKNEHYIVIDDTTGEQLTTYTLTLDAPGGASVQTATFAFTSQSNPISIIASVNVNNSLSRAKTKVSVKTHTGTAQAGTSSTITLASTASVANDFYNNCKIKLISGTGSGATTYTITGYVGSTRVATISGTFSTTPNTSTVYQIAPPTGASDDLANGRKYSANSSGTISLGKADGIRIIKIVNSTTQDDWFDNSKDVTNKYSFDNGQRDFSYEFASITLSPGQTPPTGAIVIFYEYFSSTGSGFFNVDSYTDYDDVPNYVSSTGEILDLRNCIDFRPVRDTSTTYASNNLPIARTNMNADISYYLPKIVKIAATTDREFKVISGVSSINPKPPKDLDNGMTLYSIYLNPYTFNNLDTQVKYIENKRYTMRDIGKLEKRIEKIEYYTLLSTLEKETASMDVRDAAGIDRFKNGFVVDSFRGHSIGDVFNSDYKCSIDYKNNEARPRFNTKAYDLTLKTSESSGYTQRGPLVTRSFTESNFIVQPFASQWVNVNPFSVFSWRGTMSLDPSADFWKDDVYRPANIINIEGNNDNLAFGTDWAGSRWNNWQETFNGDEPDWVEDELTASGELGFTQAVIIPIFGPGSPSDPLRWLFREIDGVPSWISGVTGEIHPAILGEPVPRSVEADTNTGTSTTNNWFNTNTTSSSINTTTINLGERVVDVSAIPWMRQIDVAFSATGMKPNTVVYPFFDGISVSANVAPTAGSFGGTLTTNSSGNISGTFRIPANRFLTGDRIFRLSDDTSNNPELESTFAQARFTANGILNHKQIETINIRIPEPQIPVPVDPVAQTFFVDPVIYPEGLFINSVDVFFRTKDAAIPVTVQIRPTVNGYPSSTQVLPFAEKTLAPGSVNTSTDGTSATNFEFPAVVYLEPGEYSLVVLANSNNYEVYIAEIGKNKLGTTELITEQPYVGSFFKSQNSSTWTAEQTQDLKFTLKRCQFSTGTFDIVLSDYPSAITRTVSGTGTIGASTVTLSDITGISIGQGVSGTGIGSGAVVTNIRGFAITLSVVNSGTVNGTLTFTGKREGNGRADVIWVGNSVIDFKNAFTNTSFVSKPVGGSLESSYVSFVSNKNYAFISQREILATTESFKQKITGTVSAASNGYISPIIDMQKNSLLTIENIVNNDSTNETTRTITFNTNTSVNGTSETITFTTPHLIQTGVPLVYSFLGTTGPAGATGPNNLVDGTTYYPRITGATGIQLYSTLDGSVTGATAALINLGSTGVSQTHGLIAVNASGGNASSKYITRRVTLKEPANYLKVYLTAARPSGTDIKVYYKIKSETDSSLFTSKPWVEMVREVPGDNTYSRNNNEFFEYVYLPPSTSPNTTSAIKYELNSALYEDFNEFTVKVVFLSSNTSIIPRIADFRAIALESI